MEANQNPFDGRSLNFMTPTIVVNKGINPKIIPPWEELPFAIAKVIK